MICTHPDHTSCSAKKGPRTRPATASLEQPAALAADTPLPLLTAIAAELRKARELDGLVSLRTARRLLEDAFEAVVHAPVMTDPEPLYQRKEPAMNSQRKRK